MRTFDLTVTDDDNEDYVFQMGDAVQLVLSHEVGNVDDMQRGKYQDEYLIVYVNAAGCQTQQWWGESWIETMTGDVH